MTANQYALKQISEYYDIPLLRFGTRVVVSGKPGKVSGISSSGLKAKLDIGKTICFHPTWETAYFDDNGDIFKDFRKS